MSKNIQEATDELKKLLIGHRILEIRIGPNPVIVFDRDLRIKLRQWDEYAPTKYSRCGEITDLRIDVDDDIYRIIVDTEDDKAITLLQVHASGFDLRVFDDFLGRNYTIEVSTTEIKNTKKYEIVEDMSINVSHMIDIIVYRIRALKDFGNVLKGDLGGELRLQLGAVINEFKVFAMLKNIPVVTASQLNRTAASNIDEAKKTYLKKEIAGLPMKQ